MREQNRLIAATDRRAFLGGVLALAAAALAPAPALAGPRRDARLRLAVPRLPSLAFLAGGCEAAALEGIEIAPLFTASRAESAAALTEGRAELAVLGLADWPDAQSGERFVALAGLGAAPRRALLREGAAAEDWRDLAGLRVAVEPGSDEWFALARGLRAHGVPFRAVEIAPSGAEADIVFAGERAVPAGFAPGAHWARGIDLAPYLPGGPALGYLAAAPGLREETRPAAACLCDGAAALAADPAALADRIVAWTGLPHPVALDEARGLAPDAAMPHAALRRRAEAARAFGLA